MAFVVAKANGRFEIREARTTRDGPRSRTLATFRVLDDAVLARAEERSAASFDRHAVQASARRAGAEVTTGASRADRAARELLGECFAGRPPAPGLAAIVRHTLRSRPVPEDVLREPQWLAATPEERGRALKDLLELGDEFPDTGARRRPPPRRLR